MIPGFKPLFPRELNRVLVVAQLLPKVSVLNPDIRSI
jgi:hypothetical protein